MQHLFCNALVHVIYSGVSGQCSHTITQLTFLIVYKHFLTWSHRSTIELWHVLNLHMHGLDKDISHTCSLLLLLLVRLHDQSISSDEVGGLLQVLQAPI